MNTVLFQSQTGLEAIETQHKVRDGFESYINSNSSSQFLWQGTSRLNAKLYSAKFTTKFRSAQSIVNSYGSASVVEQFRLSIDEAFYRRVQKIINRFNEEPLEDGVAHSAQSDFKALILTNDVKTRDWLIALLEDSSKLQLAVFVLRLLGRVEKEFTSDWAFEVAKSGLGSQSIRVRDASARALENWGGKTAISILMDHDESTPWLADYISRVIRDLKKKIDKK